YQNSVQASHVGQRRTASCAGAARTVARPPRPFASRFRYDGSMPSSMPAATRALLFLNVAVFGAQFFADDLLVQWFALWPPPSLDYPGAPAFEVWQLFTYGFLHGSVTHIFFNMFALWMFGGEIERL